MIEVTPNMYAMGMICFYFSLINFLALVYMIIQNEATKRSTHAIEYHDPFHDSAQSSYNYEELKVNKDGTDNKEEEQDIDGMNKFIKDNEVIL